MATTGLKEMNDAELSEVEDIAILEMDQELLDAARAEIARRVMEEDTTDLSKMTTEKLRDMLVKAIFEGDESTEDVAGTELNRRQEAEI